MKKKILGTLFVLLLAVGVFGMGTVSLSYGLEIVHLEVDKWRDLSVEIIEDAIGITLDPDALLREPIEVTDEMPVEIDSSASFIIGKADHIMFAIDLRGEGDITLTDIEGKDISSYITPEPGTMLLLGLLLISLGVIQRRKFNKT
jgi:hypothetical protein